VDATSIGIQSQMHRCVQITMGFFALFGLKRCSMFIHLWKVLVILLSKKWQFFQTLLYI